MRKILFISSLIFSLQIFAGEGLWNIENCKIIYPKLKELGISLSLSELYNENATSVKDAIASFGEGGSCSFVSEQGLLMTNYHLALRFVKENSTVANNYLTNGFCAENARGELPCSGLYIKLLTRTVDVTTEVQNKLQQGIPYSKIKREIVKRLIPREGNTRGDIKSLFSGLNYSFYQYQIIDDIRLVYVPPYEIAKFGDEELNWMWPRRSADFALFRAYCKDADGNKTPFCPAKHLSISTQGVNKDDFVMTIGFPGGATNSMTSSYAKNIIFPSNKDRIELMKQRLQTMKQFMTNDDSVRIQMITLYSAISNDMKKREGIIGGGGKYHCIDLLRNRERACMNILQDTSDSLYKQYIHQLRLLDSLSLCTINYMRPYDYYREGVYSVGLLQIASYIHSYLTRNQNLTAIIPVLQEKEKFFNSQMDKEIFRQQFQRIFEKGISFVSIKTNMDIDKWADILYSQSRLLDIQKLIVMLPSDSLQIGNDVAIRFIASIDSIVHTDYISKMTPLARQIDSLTNQIEHTHALTNVIRWPGTNGTLRLSYGKISEKGFYTSPNKKLKELYAKYGIHISWNDFNNRKQIVNFTSDCHTSGGNSGSPVLDKNGNLVGVNFDRKKEGLSGDYIYNKNICRNIIVDTRYILTLLNANKKSAYLLNELSIIK